VTTFFPWAPDELEEVQLLFFSYVGKDYMDSCDCGCMGFPMSVLSVDFQEKEVDNDAYLSCPARRDRKTDPRWVEFREDDTYKQFLKDIYPYRYGDAFIESQNKRFSASRSVKAKKEKKAEETAANRHCRLKAKGNNQRTYFGSKCVNGHDGERMVSTNSCVHCRDFKTKMRDAVKRGAFRETLSKADKRSISDTYARARKLSRDSGIQYHVDHIKPLSAGGRHHPSNVQVITAEENLTKGSSYRGKNWQYGKKEKADFQSTLDRKKGGTSNKMKPKKVSTWWSKLF